MASDQRVPEYEGWAVVELFGHRRLAGFIREATAFGTSLLRLDIPGDEPGSMHATQYYGGGSIYAVTPCTEEIARALSKSARETPEAIAYALPQPKKCAVSWRFESPCSTDIKVLDDAQRARLEFGDLEFGDVDRTACGRHLLERQVYLAGEREPEEPSEHASVLDPRE